MSELMISEDIFNIDIEIETERTERKIKERVEQHSQYVPKHDYDGWFHKSKTPTFDLLVQKNGPNQLKQSIDHYYFHKNFQESLRLSLEFVEFVEDRNKKIACEGDGNVDDEEKKQQYLHSNPNKLTSTRDMLEIGARSALKLGNVEIAVKCADKLSSEQLFIEEPDITLEDTFIAQISLLSFHRALKIMKTSEWFNSIDFVSNRFIREKVQIETLIHKLEEEGVDMEGAYVGGENSKLGLEKYGFESEMINYILTECKADVRVSVDQEKSVDQL
ncbi:11231_t:CDS:2 [Acaulospora colombiana]|uniref:11231_t:CDS:1 n=1 Tax=Acaulospora colombiana TaxID=27376 RepID=A0ACA9K295_9GLOM|nr:11231_t:CDS:2 [Acaulospora colombiana]